MTLKDIATEEEVAEAIHKYCLGCVVPFAIAKEFEVKGCPAYTCPLYQFRMGLEVKDE